MPPASQGQYFLFLCCVGKLRFQIKVESGMKQCVHFISNVHSLETLLTTFCQQWAGPSFTFRTALILSGIDSTRCEKYADHFWRVFVNCNLSLLFLANRSGTRCGLLLPQCIYFKVRNAFLFFRCKTCLFELLLFSYQLEADCPFSSHLWPQQGVFTHSAHSL